MTARLTYAPGFVLHVEYYLDSTRGSRLTSPYYTHRHRSCSPSITAERLGTAANGAVSDLVNKWLVCTSNIPLCLYAVYCSAATSMSCYPCKRTCFSPLF